MDTDTLVENQKDDGQRLIDQLIRDDFEVRVALWVKPVDGPWRFYVASPAVTPEKLREGYRKVYASLSKIQEAWIAPADVALLNGTHPIARAAVEIRDRYAGRVPTRYQGNRLGDIAIEEAYIYPVPRKWFKGFDEIKSHFPSAEAFSIPVLFEDLHPAKFGTPFGTINADEFEGRAPGTVFFVGPKGESGKTIGELYFVYRPEGWNTLFRADTQQYEKVQHVQTGAPLYASADFSPVAALKTSRRPGDDEIERIKSMIGCGYFITLPPDETPIMTIPCALPNDPAPMDWERLRKHMEEGGTINLHRSPTGEK